MGRKVEVHGKDGKALAEIKGVIREIEVLPGGAANVVCAGQDRPLR